MKYLLKALLFFIAFLFLSLFSKLNFNNDKHYVLNNSHELDSMFASEYYFIDSVFTDSLVPHIYVNNIPSEINELNVKARKSLFIRMLLPNILLSNKNILEERNILLELIENEELNKHPENVMQIADKYSGSADNIEELLQRVNTVPPSLAIAQAIIESGWGTSRYAIEGNALFGHHVSKNDTSKFIQSQNSNVKMKAFYSVLAAVEAYMHNINSTKSYTKLRVARADIASERKLVKGNELTKYLINYSERRGEYINELNRMIRQQNLARFDYVHFSDGDNIFITVAE